MAKRNKRKRERGAKVAGDAMVNLRFTKDGQGGLLVEGADPQNQRLIEGVLGVEGKRGPLRIPEDSVNLIDATTGKPFVQLSDPGRRDEALSEIGRISAKSIGFTEETGAVGTYLRCVRSLLEGSDGVVRSLDGVATKNEGVILTRRLWARMSMARIFELPAEHYVSLHKAADAVVTEDAKLLQINTTEAFDKMANDSLGFLRDPLPFEHVYLGFGSGVPIPRELALGRFSPGTFPENLAQYRVLGYLVVDSGVKLAVEMGYVITLNDNYLMPNVVYDSESGVVPGGWRRSILLAPWIIGSVVRLINEHKALIEEKRPGFGHRLEADRIRKKYRQRDGFIPKPYYRLVLKHETIIEDAGKRKDAVGPVRVLGFRHDRRGHERCYVRRGPLPLDEATREKLEKAEYKIWTIGRPDAVVLEQLALRGMQPKRSDEWLAVLTRQIAPKVIGDPSLPYIPAVRIPKVQQSVTTG